MLRRRRTRTSGRPRRATPRTATRSLGSGPELRADVAAATAEAPVVLVASEDRARGLDIAGVEAVLMNTGSAPRTPTRSCTSRPRGTRRPRRRFARRHRPLRSSFVSVGRARSRPSMGLLGAKYRGKSVKDSQQRSCPTRSAAEFVRYHT